MLFCYFQLWAKTSRGSQAKTRTHFSPLLNEKKSWLTKCFRDESETSVETVYLQFWQKYVLMIGRFFVKVEISFQKNLFHLFSNTKNFERNCKLNLLSWQFLNYNSIANAFKNVMSYFNLVTEDLVQKKWLTISFPYFRIPALLHSDDIAG